MRVPEILLPKYASKGEFNIYLLRLLLGLWHFAS